MIHFYKPKPNKPPTTHPRHKSRFENNISPVFVSNVLICAFIFSHIIGCDGHDVIRNSKKSFSGVRSKCFDLCLLLKIHRISILQNQCSKLIQIQDDQSI